MEIVRFTVEPVVIRRGSGREDFELEVLGQFEDGSNAPVARTHFGYWDVVNLLHPIIGDSFRGYRMIESPLWNELIKSVGAPESHDWHGYFNDAINHAKDIARNVG